MNFWEKLERDHFNPSHPLYYKRRHVNDVNKTFYTHMNFITRKYLVLLQRNLPNNSCSNHIYMIFTMNSI